MEAVASLLDKTLRPNERITLHEITEREGLDGLIDRLTNEIDSTEWSDQDKQRVQSAMQDAIDLHAGVMRGPYPYATHPLRVAIRLMSKDHLGIRNDPDLIIAALLHDAVEDESSTLINQLPGITPHQKAQELAFEVVEGQYGASVKVLVYNASTPPYPRENLTQTEKWAHYHKHVRSVLQSDCYSALIKLADFIDNCSALSHHEDPYGNHARKLADKYYPLIDDFVRYVSGQPLLTGMRPQAYLEEVILSARRECEQRRIAA